MDLVIGQKEKVFNKRFTKFLADTQFEVEKDVNPGGYYKAIWARDAAFILKDQFLSGHYKSIIHEILLIWSNQIGKDTNPSLLYCSNLKRKPLLYGRGSPELEFKSHIADTKTINRFEGAIPTTIYYERGFCEIYGQNPDIDSTSLMIYITSWILSNLIDLKDNDIDIIANTASINKTIEGNNNKYFFLDISLSDIIDFLIPRMLKAVTYLETRDTDKDGLLEQKHNEDWMDTLLRTGKVVYSQACWILALKNLSTLLKKIGNINDSIAIEEMAMRTIRAVEQQLWSNSDKCYVDHLEADLHLDEKMHNRLITQDVSLYLIAVSEGNHYVCNNNKNNKDLNYIKPITNIEYEYNYLNSEMHTRALNTLETLKNRIWKNDLPLVTEKEVEKTGPWLLKPNEYHNHTFWAWITGIEMLARNRFDNKDDFNYLLSRFISDNRVNLNMFYEWVNPLTYQGSGAYPFRTGISSVRIATIEYQLKNNI